MEMDDPFAAELRARRAEVADRERQRDQAHHRLKAVGLAAYKALREAGYTPSVIAKSLNASHGEIGKLKLDTDKTPWKPRSLGFYKRFDRYTQSRLNRT